MRKAIRLALLFLLFPLVAMADKSDGFSRLSGSQIRAAFQGHEFTDGVHWRLAFGANGRLSVIDMGKRSVGAWRLTGSMLCLMYDERERCGEVWKSGKSVRFRQEGALPEEGVLE